MRNDLMNIRNELRELAEKEATYLYRLAWRMTAHGCKKENIEQCRNEARELHMTGYPERIITYEWQSTKQYAFKIK